MINPNTTTRFSNRVENYTRYRPSYPSEIVLYLRNKFSLSERSSIADVGSGTGIFSQVLLSTGLAVTVVEPNDAMRAESDRLLSKKNSIKA